jgi:hypothetical protein
MKNDLEKIIRKSIKDQFDMYILHREIEECEIDLILSQIVEDLTKKAVKKHFNIIYTE